VYGQKLSIFMSPYNGVASDANPPGRRVDSFAHKFGVELTLKSKLPREMLLLMYKIQMCIRYCHTLWHNVIIAFSTKTVY